MTRLDFGGTWIDLDGDVLARSLGRDIVVQRVRPDLTLETLWTVGCHEPVMFTRVAVAPDGAVGVVGKGNGTGAAMFITRAGDRALGTTNGNNPIAIRHDGRQFLVLWTAPGGWLATYRADDDQTTFQPIPQPWAATSQGILDLTPDGAPIYLDAARTYVQPPWSFTKPIVRAGVRVGQWGLDRRPETNRILVGLPDRVFTGLLDTADDPRLSVLSSGRLLVAAYTPRGASLVAIDPPFPAGELPPVSAPPSAPPAPPEDEHVDKPEVTVDTFTLGPSAHLPDGEVAVFHDRVNRLGTKVRVWVENGSCRMSIEYAGGLKGETGARRPVR